MELAVKFIFIIFYGIGLIGSAFIVPPAIVGVLLELIYRHIPKKPLRVIAIILIVLAVLALIATIGVIIYLIFEIITYVAENSG